MSQIKASDVRQTHKIGGLAKVVGGDEVGYVGQPIALRYRRFLDPPVAQSVSCMACALDWAWMMDSHVNEMRCGQIFKLGGGFELPVLLWVWVVLDHEALGEPVGIKLLTGADEELAKAGQRDAPVDRVVWQVLQ